MQALDEQTLRRRRDRLFNSAPMQRAHLQLFTYMPEPPLPIPVSVYTGLHNVTTGHSQLKQMSKSKAAGSKAPVPPPVEVGGKRPAETSDLRGTKGMRGNVNNDGAQSSAGDPTNPFASKSPPPALYHGLQNYIQVTATKKENKKASSKAPVAPPPGVGEKRPSGSSDAREKKK